MKLIYFDAHVHLYPKLNFAKILSYGYQNLRKIALLNNNISANNSILALLVVDRYDYSGFNQLHQDGNLLQQIKPWRLNRISEICSEISPNQSTDFKFYLISGNQYVSSEGIEVLTLCAPYLPKIGVPFKELIDSSEVVCVPWSLGKWNRHRLNLIQNNISYRRFYLGDITQRADFPLIPIYKWPKLELPILRGSDPLPLSGEERYIGSLWNSVKINEESTDPSINLKTELLSYQELNNGGSRNSVFTSIYRRICYSLER
jgi:hypothetical protein